MLCINDVRLINMDPPPLFLPYNNILALPTLTLTPLPAIQQHRQGKVIDSADVFQVRFVEAETVHLQQQRTDGLDAGLRIAFSLIIHGKIIAHQLFDD